MDYLVIDLEMCRVKKLYRKTYKYASEIIQIGAVLLDEGFNRTATMCEYVNPEYGVLDNFIESMTGIKNRDIKQAPKLTEALEHLSDWLGDREYKVYAWSDSDRTQILHEIKAKNIESAKIDDFMKADRWIDYQDVFKKRFDLDRCYSLEDALESAEIEPEGRFHDGLDDAVNTGALIKKLELNPEYEIAKYALPESDEHLSCTIGDLFEGLQLKFGEYANTMKWCTYSFIRECHLWQCTGNTDSIIWSVGTMIFTGADVKHYTACLPAHVLQQYGEIRHESKNAAVSYGT